MTRPLVLIDVDGVVNALGVSLAWDDWRDGHAVADERAFPIRWSPTVVSRVLGWTEVADVQWLTTWGHDANTSLRHLLAMPELTVAGTHTDPDGQQSPEAAAHAQVTPAARDALTGRWWKFDVVRRLVQREPGRPVVWLDDDLAGQRDVHAWMHAHTDCLLVAPDPGSGLTADQLDAIGVFLDAQV